MPTPPENSVIGQIWAWARIDCGPTVGLIRRPLFNDKYLTTGSSYSIQPFDQRIIVQLDTPGAMTIQLPSVLLWMRQPYGLFPINFKDGSNNAATFPILINTTLPDTIDGLTSVSIESDGGSATLVPNSDLTSWTLAP